MGLKRPDTVRALIAFVLLIASLYAVMASARPFAHYAVLLLWPLTLFAGLSWSLASQWPARNEARRWRAGQIVGALSVFVIGLSLFTKQSSIMIPKSRELSVFSAPASYFKAQE